jgi:hypothetical protein
VQVKWQFIWEQVGKNKRKREKNRFFFFAAAFCGRFSLCLDTICRGAESKRGRMERRKEATTKKKEKRRKKPLSLSCSLV